MKKLFLTTIFFTLFCSFSNLYARDNWQSAYVIINENDTLFGQVDFRTSRANQQQCLFRKNDRSEVIVFSPDDILGYRFTPDGKFYMSKEVDINGFPERTFIEFMVKGMINLYYFVDNNNQSHFLFEDQDGEVFAITRQSDRVESNRIIQDNRFDGLIRRRFQEHPSIAFNPERFEFNQRSMINLAVTYHDLVCPIGEECIIFENQRPDRRGIRVNYSVHTGLNRIVFGFEHNRITKYGDAGFAPTLGFGVEFSLPQRIRGFSLYADVAITRLEHRFDYVNYEIVLVTDFWGDDYQGFFNRIDLNVFPLSARTGIKYTFHPRGRFSYVLKGGFTFQHLIGDATVTRFWQNRNDGIVALLEPSNIYSKSYIGFHGALGAEYNLKNDNAIFLYLQLDRCAVGQRDNSASARIVSNSLITHSLQIGYRF